MDAPQLCQHIAELLLDSNCLNHKGWYDENRLIDEVTRIMYAELCDYLSINNKPLKSKIR